MRLSDLGTYCSGRQWMQFDMRNRPPDFELPKHMRCGQCGKTVETRKVDYNTIETVEHWIELSDEQLMQEVFNAIYA